MTTPPLQPGQYWRTRSGSIVYVDSILPEWAGISIPVIVISKHEKVGHKVEFYHRNGCHFVNRESPHDLVTYLPDCTSLDWVPPEYPQWRVRDDKYGYLFRASEDTPWVRFNKHGASVPDRECLHIEAWRVTTQEDAESRIQEQAPPEVESIDDWVPQESVPARIVDEYRWSNWPSGEWRGVTQSMERQGVSSGARSLFMRGVTLSVRCRRKDHPSQQKQPVPHTAPEVWSLIEKADEKNDRRFANTLHGTVKLLIRICSAQQSMLSELSAQVDALRSEKTNRGGCCGQPD